MAQLQLIKTSSTTLTAANAGANEFLQRIKTGIWLNCTITQARNYLFLKRFFALLNLGFEYWTPTGGTVTQSERQYLSGYIRYLISIVANDSILLESEREYNCKYPTKTAHSFLEIFRHTDYVT
ncbi:DUF1367 family protein [uncultured Pluralibacter sp.]|uniref:DUF1367 family protein n=1 Tax=uncultured Pluralibacter sp. TaxID=1490864 RepID=UPI00260FE2A6|nr:DUF1367 family protein [uncultured Pluralibacter sp.]